MSCTRKTLLFAGITAVACIGTGSVAFACLVTRGQIAVTGTTTTGDIVKGTGAVMTYCYNPTVAAQTYHGTTGQVTVAVAPTTCGTTTTQLPDAATYQVALQKDTAKFAWTRASGSTAWAWNTAADNACWDSNVPATVTLATTFNVVNGSATATFSIPAFVAASGANDAHSICVGTPTSAGAFAPLRLT
jgi:hypothetical protein